MPGDDVVSICLGQVFDGFFDHRNEVFGGIDAGVGVDDFAVRIAEVHAGVATGGAGDLLAVAEVDGDVGDGADHLPGRNNLVGHQFFEFGVFEKRGSEGARVGARHGFVELAEHAEEQDGFPGALGFLLGVLKRIEPSDSVDGGFGDTSPGKGESGDGDD